MMVSVAFISIAYGIQLCSASVEIAIDTTIDQGWKLQRNQLMQYVTTAWLHGRPQAPQAAPAPSPNYYADAVGVMLQIGGFLAK